MRRSVGRTGAPASIPKQPGRAARFTDVGAAGQIGSRTDLPHCTSRHRVDVDRARDWPYLPEPESLLPDRRPPEPLFASAVSPEFSSRPRLEGVVETPGPDPSLQAAWDQYRHPPKARKCRCFFGLAHFRVHRMWRVTRAGISPWRGRPHDVELCIHIVHVPTSRLGTDFEVTVGLVGVRRDEEEARATRREPAGDQLG